MEQEEESWNYKDLLRLTPALVIAGVIFYFSSLSDPIPRPPPSTGPEVLLELDLNTILHICEYALLSFLVAFGSLQKTKGQYLIAITGLYALSDEIHQYFVPNRYFDIYDVIVDFIGVLIGFMAYLLVKNLMTKFKEEEIIQE